MAIDTEPTAFTLSQFLGYVILGPQLVGVNYMLFLEQDGKCNLVCRWLWKWTPVYIYTALLFLYMETQYVGIIWSDNCIGM